MMNIKEETRKMKLVAPLMATASIEQRNLALQLISDSLIDHKDEIFAANQKDLALAETNHVAAPVKKRLTFNEGKLSDVTAELKQLISLDDPISQVTLARELDEGLQLFRVTCPIGVIGVIFEARPDALVQISSLCLKSGNCAILKGGKETTYTNRILFPLLECHESVDLLIPRGSNQFVQYIMSHTSIPVLGHADGVCHIYVDQHFDEATALRVIVDAKTQYPAACNAVETILIHRAIGKEFLPSLAQALTKAGVTMRGTEEVNEIIPVDVIPGDESFHKEYLNDTLAIKLVGDEKEAIEHINRYGSHHTDCIITTDNQAAKQFMLLVDSAGVYQNASTRFADGFRYGFGAEVGISTSKIHARGPVGLEGLISYKYKLFGHGQIVGDYASGKKQFHFKEIDKKAVRN